MATEILTNEKEQSKVTFENFFLNTFANFEKISSDERKMLKNTNPNFIRLIKYIFSHKVVFFTLIN